MMKSSDILEKCMLKIDNKHKNSITKSLSETLSKEFSVGFLKPKFLAKAFLSIS